MTPPLASREPETREEWQEAVDAAHALVAIDAARIYGLIAGGPNVNVDRCMEILNGGLRQLPPVVPRIDSIERTVRAIGGHPALI